MAEANETKVNFFDRPWEDEFMSIMNRMTEDDWCRFKGELRQMREQKTGLYAFLKERSDDTSNDDRKRTNELRKQNEKWKQEMEELQKERRRKQNEGWKQIIDELREELKRRNLTE